MQLLRQAPNPTPIQKSFLQIVNTLEEYKAYLPSTLKMQVECAAHKGGTEAFAEDDLSLSSVPSMGQRSVQLSPSSRSPRGLGAVSRLSSRFSSRPSSQASKCKGDRVSHIALGLYNRRFAVLVIRVHLLATRCANMSNTQVRCVCNVVKVEKGQSFILLSPKPTVFLHPAFPVRSASRLATLWHQKKKARCVVAVKGSAAAPRLQKDLVLCSNNKACCS